MHTRAHQLFIIAVVLKGLHAIIELVAAFVVYFLGSTALLFITRVSEIDLSNKAGDMLMDFFVNQATQVFTSARGFVTVYLLISAVVNFLLVYALLSQRLKAYPISIGILGTFALYQIYRISITHSPWLTLFTFFDLLVIGLIYFEYLHHKSVRDRSLERAPTT